MTIARFQPTPCPSCRYVMNAAEGIEDRQALPIADDLTVCFGCGEILIFKADMTLREVTPLEFSRLDRELRLQLFDGQRRVRRFNADRRAVPPAGRFGGGRARGAGQ